jgi:xanthine/uracil permease
VLGRAVTWQGLCCTIAGLFGTANGTTAYNENIGAMQVRTELRASTRRRHVMSSNTHPSRLLPL